MLALTQTLIFVSYWDSLDVIRASVHLYLGCMCEVWIYAWYGYFLICKGQVYVFYISGFEINTLNQTMLPRFFHSHYVLLSLGSIGGAV